MRMHHERFDEMNKMMEELNLTEEQKMEVEKLKKAIKKERMIFAAKYIIGRLNIEEVSETIIQKIEKAEDILDQEQKSKLREMLKRKHKKMFMHILMARHDEIQELIEKLELSEEQKDRVEALFGETENLECFEFKEKIESILTEEQLAQAKEEMKEKLNFNKVFDEMGINENQKEKLEKLHERMHNGKKEKMEKLMKGEISFSQMAKEKLGLFSEVQNILSKEQLKKLHKLHKSHCCVR